MSIRLVRIFTGNDGQSHFAVGDVPLQREDAINALSSRDPAQAVFFEETAAGSKLD